MINREYYGAPSTPNENFLAHYGIKGMKWGVRRAIERGNQKALARHYAKAENKLKQLSARSDRDLVKMVKKQNAKNTVTNTLASGLMSGGLTMGLNSHLPESERLKWSAIAGGVGAGASALAGGINHARLTAMGSKRGNVKQNAKRKAWEKEMRQAFKGTRYARQIDKDKKDIHYSIESAKRQYDPNYLSKKQARDTNHGFKSASRKRRR